MITKEMIRDGIQAKLVEFIVDPNMESGTACRIGDSWFYFGGQTADEMNPDEYIANVPQDDIVNEIYLTLDDFMDVDELRDEYEYYEAVLRYRND